MISIFCLLTAHHKLEKCLHIFLFITLKNHRQGRSQKELILSNKHKEFYAKAKNIVNEQMYFSLCCEEKGKLFYFQRKAF